MTNQYGQRLLLAVLLLCTLCFGAMAEQLQAEDTQAASFHSAKTEIVLVEDAKRERVPLILCRCRRTERMRLPLDIA